MNRCASCGEETRSHLKIDGRREPCCEWCRTSLYVVMPKDHRLFSYSFGLEWELSVTEAVNV